MSNAMTRSQYAYIEVKRNSDAVMLYGPTEVLSIIKDNIKGTRVASLGSTMKIMINGSNIMLLKVAIVEEVLKHGFAYDDTPSSFKDDYIVFSRQVKL